MPAYIARRLLEVIPTVLLVLTLVFLALRVLPGDPAVAALGEFATPDAIASFRHKLGLDQSLWLQYVSFLRQAMTGDFGQSMTNGTSINTLLARSLPYTMELAAAALLFGMVIGVPLGVWTADDNVAARWTASAASSRCLGFRCPTSISVSCCCWRFRYASIGSPCWAAAKASSIACIIWCCPRSRSAWSWPRSSCA